VSTLIYIGVVAPLSNHFGDERILEALHHIWAHKRMMCRIRQELEHHDEGRTIREIIEAIHLGARELFVHVGPSCFSASEGLDIEARGFLECFMSLNTIAVRSCDIQPGKDADDFYFSLFGPLPAWLLPHATRLQSSDGARESYMFSCRVKLIDAAENFSGNQALVKAGTNAMKSLLQVRTCVSVCRDARKSIACVFFI
jgi:hypothetical protein